jgi:hypothetical protein
MSTKVNFTNRIDLDPTAIKSKLVVNSAIPGEYEISMEGDLSDIALTGEFTIVLTHKALGETNRYELPGQNELRINITHPLHGMRNPLEVVSQLEIIQRDSKNIPVIRASVRNINPEIPGEQSAKKSALKTKRDPDLNVPWRLDYSEGYPILHITDKNGLYDQLLLTPQFDPLTLPEVARQVFNWVIFDPSLKDSFHVDAWKLIFEQLGCERAFFDSLPTPNDEDGSMEDMTPALRAQIASKSQEVADKLTSDLDLLNRLSNTEIGDE